MKKCSEYIFEALLFSFSAMMLVMMLLCTVQLYRLEDSSIKTEALIIEQRSENLLLEARCESFMGLSELEEYALNVLHMQQARPWQTVYLEPIGD